MALTSLLIGAGSGLMSSIFGVSQRVRARRLERNNIRPTYRPNSLIGQNLADAQAMARRGLPSEVYNAQLNQMEQGLSTGMRGLSRGATNAFNVARLLSGYNSNLMNLNAMDAQARMQNQRQLFGAREAMAGEQRRAFEINQLQPYQQTRQEIASLRRAGDQNIFGGLSLIGQTAMMTGVDGLNFGGMFGRGQTPNLNRNVPLNANPRGWYTNNIGVSIPTTLR